MERHTRRLDWMSRPLAERLSFSSFSQSVDDIWAYDIERDYQIVLMPGYKVPEGLDRGDRDALWYHKETVTDRPVIVWDGFSSVALFEIIRECFDYTGTNDFIKVRDAKSKKLVSDVRDPAILAVRPRREAGWGPRQIRNHLTELCVWSTLLPSGGETHKIYTEILSSHGAQRQDSTDSYERAQSFMKRSMSKVDLFDLHAKLLKDGKNGVIRFHKGCSGGPVPKNSDQARILRDNDVELLDTTISGSSDLASLRADDLLGGAPKSFYRLAAAKGRREADDRRKSVAIDPEKTSRVLPDPLPGASASKPKRAKDNPF